MWIIEKEWLNNSCSHFSVALTSDPLSMNISIFSLYSMNALTLQSTGVGALYAPPSLVFCLLIKIYWDNPYPENSWPCKPFCCGCPMKKIKKEIKLSSLKFYCYYWCSRMPSRDQIECYFFLFIVHQFETPRYLLI